MALPPPGGAERGWLLKAYEDKLDAVICAGVAIACLTEKQGGLATRLCDLDPDCRRVKRPS